MTRRRWAVAGVVSGVLLAGCAAILGFEDTTLRDSDAQAPETGTPPDTGPGVLPDGEVPDAATPKLSVDPSPIVVRRGGKSDVKVNIVRTTDIIGEITVTVADLPAGVTATTATIAPGASTGTLTVTATGAAPVGAKAVKVTPSIPALPTVETQLLVSEGAGELDTTFASVGFLTDGTAGTGAVFRALALSGTNIVAGGVAGAGGWLVRRFGPTGAPDATFKPDMNLPDDGEINALAVDAMGRVLCVGRSSGGVAQPVQLTIARLTATGALDGTFGTGGVARLGGPDANLLGSTGLAVAIEAAGTILVAGSRNELGDESGILVRYTATGTRDNAFNGGAAVTVAKNRFVGVAVDGAGMVVAGTDSTTTTPSFFVTRRNATGAVDGTFGDAGAFTFGGGFRANDFVRFNDGALAVVGDGIAGNVYTAGSATGKGALVYARTVGTAAGATLQGVAALGDKRIVAAGHGGGANAEARVQRLLADGGLDPTFGDGGATFVDPGGVANGFDVTLFATLLQPDGRIVVAGGRSGAGGIIYRIWP